MDPIARMVAAGAAGAGGGDPTYVDDVFSTYLYTGTGSTITVNNGIDLSGEGGLVWTKSRNNTDNGAGDTSHRLTDTELQRLIFSNSTADATLSGYQRTFNSNGFTDSYGWSSGNDIASWTFRKAPGFFDVVTYTGTGSTQNISHSLGSTPGLILIKCTSAAYNWTVWHRSLGTNQFLRLNSTSGAGTSSAHVPSVSSTTFTCGGDDEVNGNNRTYVAYVFAHDDQSFGTNSDESIIKCGSFTTDGSYNGSVTLGWEPQWVMVKNTSASGHWFIHDVMRGAPVSGDNNWIKANANEPEYATSVAVRPNATGFTTFNHSSNTNMIYMAIRRPNKPPTAATEVFALDTYGGILPNPPGFNAGFSVDSALTIETTPGSNTTLNSRLTQGRRLNVNITNAEDDNTIYMFDYQDGWNSSNAVTTDYISYMFRRVPGLFDVVAYTGTGSLSGVNHNLGVTPELKITKSRSHASDWVVGGSALTNLNYGYMYINSNAAASIGSAYWNSSSSDSATVFSVRNTNAGSDYSGRTYIAYLFSSLDGISKVGTYTGTGSNINVDCGFTAGARFILIKRMDSTGDWYVWDTLRGIGSGDDPYKRINLTAAQITTTDYVDPLNAGFTVTANAPAELNANGGTYLFLAMA